MKTEKILFMVDKDVGAIKRAYSDENRQFLEKDCGDAIPLVCWSEIGPGDGDIVFECEYLFSTWNMPRLTDEQVKRSFPRLKGVFYAAGTVKYFAEPYLANGIRVFSAARANADPVAQMAASAIVLANKGVLRARITPLCIFPRARRVASLSLGNHDCCVGILGAGKVGRATMETLRSFGEFTFLVYDPFLSEEDCAAIGAHKASLEEVFSRCDAISNHMPDLPDTRGILDYDLFGSMKNGAVFVNTARGAQVDERGLAKALRKDPTLSAVLDVTSPEPIRPWNPLLRLRNVYVTPHVAGSQGKEVFRLGEAMVEEYKHFVAGEACPNEVTMDMLSTMA